MSAQLIQSSAQASFSVGKEKGKGKGKAKGKGKGRHTCSTVTSVVGGPSTTIERTEGKTECRACGRKGHWANDRESAMSSSSSSTQNQTRTGRLATRMHISNQANQVGVCFVLNEDSDDLDTSAYMVGENVPLPMEATEQVPLTPTASAAVGLKNTATFNDRAMDDSDEPWTTEADHRTGWNQTFKSGTNRGILYGIVLRDFPKQVVSLTKAKSLSTNMREFLSWTQRHYRNDVTASTVERKTGGLASTGVCPTGCKEFLTKVRTRLWYRSKARTPSAATRPSYMFSSTQRSQGEQRTHAKDILC